MQRRMILLAGVVTVVAFTAAQSLFVNFSDVFSSEKTEKVEIKTPKPASIIYGIPTDSLVVLEGVVESGATISTLLNPHNISTSTIQELSAKARGVFSFRKIRPRHKYTLLHARDSLRTAQYLIYEPNLVEYVVFDLKDSLAVTLHQRKIELVEREMVGEIKGSLYQSILEAGGTAQLVNQLADIYAWRLDLNHIQAGDTYKLIFEEKQVNGKTIESGTLKGAFIEHKGQPLYAIGFDQGNGFNYFDQDGQSFKKAFLKEPVEYSRISSRYTQSRFHPVQKRFKAHLGTDFAAPHGTPIRSVGDGIIVEAARNSGNGNYVKIKHNKTYTTQYLHMSRFAKGIRRGSRVAMGQTIGYVGSTGLSTGPHLCYRFWKNGRQVDALKEKLPAANPVDEDHMTDFMVLRGTIVNRMEAMNITGSQDNSLASRNEDKNSTSI